MGKSCSSMPPPPLSDWDPGSFRERRELKPMPPLPWLYRDPQRYVLPFLIVLLFIALMALTANR